MSFSGTGDVVGYITGGHRSNDWSLWHFTDQSGNVVTSVPYDVFKAKYTTPDGSMDVNAGPVNGYDFYYSDVNVEKRRQQWLLRQQKDAARANPGGFVSIAPGMGSMRYDPDTDQYTQTDGPEFMRTQPEPPTVEPSRLDGLLRTLSPEKLKALETLLGLR